MLLVLFQGHVFDIDVFKSLMCVHAIFCLLKVYFDEAARSTFTPFHASSTCVH